jgi:sugar phosphate isomerase/epimerase
MKIAFSTVGCPDLSLERVVQAAARWGYQGVDLRVSPTGVAATPVASDPMGKDPAAVHDLFEDAGVDLVGIATGVRFDEAVWPPVMGHLLSNAEVGVAETKAAVTLAAGAGGFFVRVFGHQLPGGEPRAWGLRRVAERLALAAQTARNTSVRVLIENSGSFSRAEELAELHGLVSSPFLSMSYNIIPAVMAGECPMTAVEAVIDGLKVVKIADIGEDGRPMPLGTGRLPVEKFVRRLGEIGYQGWIVYEYPRLWRPELGETAGVLEAAAGKLFAWTGRSVVGV